MYIQQFRRCHVLNKLHSQIGLGIMYVGKRRLVSSHVPRYSSLTFTPPFVQHIHLRT